MPKLPKIVVSLCSVLYISAVYIDSDKSKKCAKEYKRLSVALIFYNRQNSLILGILVHFRHFRQ